MSIRDTVAATYAKLAGKGLAATAVLTRVVPGAFDTTTGTNAAGTTTTSACFAVLDSSSLKTLGFKFGEGLVQGGEILATVPAKGLSFDPAAGDTLTTAGVPFVVIDVQPTYAGDVAVMFSCLVRK